jgi:hypothetical protein
MLKCYRWTRQSGYDRDIIGLYTQRAGGHFEPRVDTVLFWVPDHAESMFVSAWPDLERKKDQDLI